MLRPRSSHRHPTFVLPPSFVLSDINIISPQRWCQTQTIRWLRTVRARAWIAVFVVATAVANSCGSKPVPSSKAPRCRAPAGGQIVSRSGRRKSFDNVWGEDAIVFLRVRKPWGGDTFLGCSVSYRRGGEKGWVSLVGRFWGAPVKFYVSYPLKNAFNSFKINIIDIDDSSILILVIDKIKCNSSNHFFDSSLCSSRRFQSHIDTVIYNLF